MLPFEKNTIRLYNFFFEGRDKPLIMEAENLQQAINYLSEEFQKRGLVGKEKLVNHTVITPIFGITEKDENGVTYIWVGFEVDKSGWMDKETFDKQKYIY